MQQLAVFFEFLTGKPLFFFEQCAYNVTTVIGYWLESVLSRADPTGRSLWLYKRRLLSFPSLICSEQKTRVDVYQKAR